MPTRARNILQNRYAILTEGELARFQHHVEEVIERQGASHISQDVGMFEACQPNTS